MAVMAVDSLTVKPPADMDRIGSFEYKKIWRSYDVAEEKLKATNETLKSTLCTQ
jgi:hypothetical protein